MSEKNSYSIKVKILASIAVLILGLVSIEGMLRLYNLILPAASLSSDKNIRFRGKPNEEVYGYKLNSQGFKDKEHPLEKPAGQYRIAVIGDSFAFGTVPYPDNVFTILEDGLGEAATNRIDVINMGIPGTEPPDYLRLLKNEAINYRPDMVVVFFYVGNDIVLFLDSNDVKTKHRLYIVRLFDYARAVFKRFGFAPSAKHEYKEDIPHQSDVEYMKLLSVNTGKYGVNPDGNYRLLLDPALKNEYVKCLLKIIEMKEFCKERAVEFLVVLVPEDMQVVPELQRSLLSILPKDIKLDFNAPNKLLASDFGMYKIRYFDMTESFKTAYQNGSPRMYSRGDTHWNVLGNKFAAETLLRFMTGYQPIKQFIDSATKQKSR